MDILYKHVQEQNTGYGRAARDYIEALKEDHNVLLKNTNDGADITIHHVPPENSEREYNGVQIGLSAWETTKLPDHWVQNINHCYDVQVVPSFFNLEVYKRSGVTIPIFVIPHIVKPPQTEDKLCLPKEIRDKYKFFSVFQWTPRKNPQGLLKGYFSAFYGDKDVVLILKVHRSNYSMEEQNMIKADIKQIAHDMRLKENKLPSIFLITQELSDLEMDMLYNTGDCFVLPHRGEGFGLPIAEAMVHSKPVIVTNFSGTKDLPLFYEEKIEYFLTPVSDMPWIKTYDGTQLWAEPDVHSMMEMMKHNKENNVTKRKNNAIYNYSSVLTLEKFNEIFNRYIIA